MSRNKTALLLLLAASLLLSACSISVNEPVVPEKLAVSQKVDYETTEATIGVYSREEQGSATVYYPVSANLTWDTANAKLQEMKVKKNQQVKKGDVLAVFEIATSEAQQTELQLQLQRKNEEFAKGKTTRLTAIQTAKTNLAEQSSLQRKIAELELAKLEIAYEQYVYQTEREIATLQERVDRFLKTQTDTVLLAPFDGVVESVASVREGEKVKVGQVILSMYSEEEFYLRVKKPGEKLRYGMEVTVETGRTNQRETYKGIVIAAPNILSSSMGQADAYIRIADTVVAGDIQGSTLFHSTQEYLENVLILENKALSREDGEVYVKVLEDGTLKKRYVTQGLSGTDISWIIDGLHEGQQVITN